MCGFITPVYKSPVGKFSWMAICLFLLFLPEYWV